MSSRRDPGGSGCTSVMSLATCVRLALEVSASWTPGSPVRSASEVSPQEGAPPDDGGWVRGPIRRRRCQYARSGPRGARREGDDEELVEVPTAQGADRCIVARARLRAGVIVAIVAIVVIVHFFGDVVVRGFLLVARLLRLLVVVARARRARRWSESFARLGVSATRVGSVP